MVSKIVTILYALIEAVKRIVAVKRHTDIAKEIKERDDEKTRETLNDILR